MNPELRAALVNAAQDLPRTVVDAIVNVAAAEPGWSIRARNRLLDAHPAAASKRHSTSICESWKNAPEVTGAAIAAGLEVGQRTAQHLRESQDIEIAWTSPNPGALAVRTTRQALVETIRAATNTLYCLSFAAYKDHGIITELAAASGRGVTVRLVLDTKEGGLTHDARQAFTVLDKKVHFYTWPVNQRPIIGVNPARFHAKAIIADGHTAFVTSANLTGAAMDSNIELGVVVTGGRVPRDLLSQIDNLIESGVLAPIAG